MTASQTQKFKRAVIRLQLDVGAKQALDELSERRGMTQIAVLSRVVKWFAVQDEALQAVVLGHFSPELAAGLQELATRRDRMVAKEGV